MSINFKKIDEGVDDLKSDFTNGARVLATKALQTLHDAIEGRLDEADGEQFWRAIRIAAYRLSQARPSMSAAVTSALVEALDAVGGDVPSAKSAIARAIANREQTGARIAMAFEDFVRQPTTARIAAPATTRELSLLTLSSSSTLHECLIRAIREVEDVRFTVRVLESRPNCEGADFAVMLLKECSSEVEANRLRVSVSPDTHVCGLAGATDVLLLGADRISGEGDVSNKMGSLAAALSVKVLSSRGKVVVVSDSDKIARAVSKESVNEERGPASEVVVGWSGPTKAAAAKRMRDSALEIDNRYFEWVPAKYIDLYLTETGGMDSQQISQKAVDVGETEDRLFEEEIRASAKT